MSNNEATETDKALAVIEAARDKFGPIYLGGSRRMHELAGDQLWDKRLAEFRATHPEKRADSYFPPTEQDIIESMVIPINEDTDYDFYAAYSAELDAFLRANGFEPTMTFDKDCDDGYDPDDLCVMILCRENVQIVLRTDAELYKAVFENLTPEFYRQYLWKSSGEPTVVRSNIQMIFNVMFNIAAAARKI